MCAEAQSMLPHDRASIALADRDASWVSVYATSGRAGTLSAGTVLPVAGSIVGRVIATGTGFYKADLEQEADLIEKPGLIAMGIRSNITAPLWHRGACFGSLNFGSFQLGVYGPEQMLLAENLAKQVEVSIFNARQIHELLHLRLVDRLIGQPEGAGSLTERELEVVQLLGSSARNKEIAAVMCVTVHTVKFHLANVYLKLGAGGRAEAVRLAGDLGLLNV